MSGITHRKLLFWMITFSLANISMIAASLPGLCQSQPANTHVRKTKFIIRAGNEKLVSQKFESPQDFLPFELSEISILPSSIVLKFLSADKNDVEIELVHPSAAVKTETVTDNFAVIVKSPGPGSATLVDKIVNTLETPPHLDVWIKAPTKSLSIPSDFLFFKHWLLIIAWFTLLLLLFIQWPAYQELGFLPILGLFMVSWTLGKSLGTVSPGDWDFLVTHYGHASVAIFSLLKALDILSPENLISLARILVALGSIFIALAVFELKSNRTLALAAGLLLAIQPIIIRFSSDCERQSYVIFFGTLAIWGTARFLRRKSLISLAIALISVTLCGLTRPEAVAIIPMALILVWPGHRLDKAALLLVLPILVIGLSLALAFPSEELFASEGSLVKLCFSILGLKGFWDLFFNVDFTPPAISFLVFLGIFTALYRRDRTGVWATLCFIIIQLIRAKRPTCGFDLHNARFATLGFIPFSILGAFAIDEIARRVPWATVRFHLMLAIVGLLFITGQKQYERVLAPTTMDLEFQFLLAEIPALPLDAVIYHPYVRYDIGFMGIPRLAEFLNRQDLRWEHWNPTDHNHHSPSIFYMHSLCHGVPKPMTEQQVTHATNYRPKRTDPRVTDLISVCRSATDFIKGDAIAKKTILIRETDQKLYIAPKLQIGFWPMVR